MKSFTRTTTTFLSMLLLSFGLLFAACEPAHETDLEANEESERQGEMGARGMPDAEIDEIEGDPAEYIGRTVTVEGEIEDVYGKNAFTLEGDLFSGDLLVIVPPDVGAGMMFEDDAEVRITGRVAEYVEAEIEADYGFDLDDGIDYEEREPVVIAQRVILVEMD